MKLLIPGPVTTHPDVRAAAARDYAPWDPDFRAEHAVLRARLLRLADGREGEHVVLPVQGCGHFAMEAAIRSFLPAGGRLLVPATGQYADRIARLAEEAGRVVVRLQADPDRRLSPAAVTAALQADPGITHFAPVYSETSSGVVHDAPALARAAGALGRRVILDAVSAFGALPLDIGSLPMVDAVVFTANKCLEGLPGTAFVVARIDRLIACAGGAGSWSFDLADLYGTALRAGPGTSRFTPAAGVLAALGVALDLHAAEGGGAARLARYRANADALMHGLPGIGLRPCLDGAEQGPIVVNVHAPDDPGWDLQRFVVLLKARGFLISNFHNTPYPSFRVGCIGQLRPDDLRGFLHAVDAALREMAIRTRDAA